MGASCSRRFAPSPSSPPIDDGRHVRVARRESRSQAMVPVGGDEPALLVAEEPDRGERLAGRDRCADGGSLTSTLPAQHARDVVSRVKKASASSVEAG